MKTRFDLEDIYPQLTRVETTTGNNGYPQSLQYAYYCDNKKEMKEVIEHLKSQGQEIEELFIRKKNGWQLWNRESTPHSLIDLCSSNENDYTCSFDMDSTEEEIKDEIKLVLYSDDDSLMEELGEERVSRGVDEFYKDISIYKDRGFITVFYDANNGNWVDYVVTEDSTGYHDGDVTTYQMAFTAYEQENEEL